jgi:hypothetical protein
MIFLRVRTTTKNSLFQTQARILNLKSDIYFICIYNLYVDGDDHLHLLLIIVKYSFAVYFSKHRFDLIFSLKSLYFLLFFRFLDGLL